MTVGMVYINELYYLIHRKARQFILCSSLYFAAGTADICPGSCSIADPSVAWPSAAKVVLASTPWGGGGLQLKDFVY